MSFRHIFGFLLYFVAASLAWFGYRNGVDPITVVLTVGSGIAASWLRGTTTSSRTALRLLVGWCWVLMQGTVVAGIEGEVLGALPLFFAGLSSLMASVSVWTYPALTEANRLPAAASTSVLPEGESYV